MKKLSIVLISVFFLTLAFSQYAFAENESNDNCIYICFNDQQNHTKVIDVYASEDSMWDNMGNAVTDEADAAVTMYSRTVTLKNYKYDGEGYTPQGESTAYGIYSAMNRTVNVDVQGNCELDVDAPSDYDACGIYLDSGVVNYGLFINGGGDTERNRLEIDVDGKNSCAFSSYNVILNGLSVDLKADADNGGEGIGFKEKFKETNTVVYIQEQTLLTAQTEDAVFKDDTAIDFTKYGKYQKVTAGLNAETASELEIPQKCKDKPYVKIEPKEVGARLQVCFKSNEGEKYFKDIIAGGAWDNYGKAVADPDKANVIYDRDSNTLTLRNYEYSSKGGAVVGIGGVVKNAGIFLDTQKSETNLVIEGNCSLSVSDNDSGECDIAGVYCADYSTLNIREKKNASFKICVSDGSRGESCGIDGNGDIVLDSASQDTKADYDICSSSENNRLTVNSYGIISHLGNVTIKNSNIDVKTGIAAFVSAGIRAAGSESDLDIESCDCTIEGCTTVAGKYADASCGILATCEVISEEATYNNDVCIRDSKMDINGGNAKLTSRGIDMSGNLEISGSDCKVKIDVEETELAEGNYCIGAHCDISIKDNAQVDAQSPSDSAICLYDEKKSIKFDNYGGVPAAYVVKMNESEYMRLDDPTECAAHDTTGDYRCVKIEPVEMKANIEKYTAETETPLVLTAEVNGKFFSGIEVNGTALDSGNYEVNRGESTVITVSSDYLDSLEDGTYKFTAVWNTTYAGKCSVSKGLEVLTAGSIKKCRIMLSDDTFVFNNKIQKPEVKVTDPDGNILTEGDDYTVVYSAGKSVGTYRIAIKGTGSYSGTVCAEYVIKPAPKAIKSITAGKKKLIVRWSKSSKAYLAQTSCCQIQYSTSKSFKSKKTLTVSRKAVQKTITKLRAHKKYYVRMRVCKVADGQKYYSAWSKVKAKKTK